MANRKRDIQVKFRVTPQERDMIEAKMAQIGTTNMAAYLRKMAIDGYVQSVISGVQYWKHLKCLSENRLL